MNGSRVLIALNHDSNDCKIKLVDISKSEPKTNDVHENSFVEGLTNIIQILKTFMFTYEYRQSQLEKQLEKGFWE